MREITLTNPKEVLKVNVGEESFNIPLIDSMPFDFAINFRKATKEEQVDILMDYLKSNIPPEVFSTLTAGAIKQLIEAWVKASSENEESLGES